MFDVGFWEILLILVMALVIIGPERLPGAARKAGLFVGKARRYVEGVRTEVEQELDVNEFKRLLHNQEVQINELQHQIKSSVDNVGAEIKKDLPASDFLTDTSSHTFHEDAPSDDSAGHSLEQANKSVASENDKKVSSTNDEK